MESRKRKKRLKTAISVASRRSEGLSGSKYGAADETRTQIRLSDGSATKIHDFRGSKCGSNFVDMKKPNLFRLGQVIEKYGRDGVIRTLDP